MPRSLHSGKKRQTTVRSLTAPSMFAAFPEEMRELLITQSVFRKFAHGQIIQQRGDNANGFYVIKSGHIKMGRFSNDGEFNVVLMMGPGDSYGELSVLGGFSRIVDVVAVGETEAYWIRGSEIDALISKDETFARNIIQIMAQQLQEALDSILTQRRLSTASLLGRMLVSMCSDQDGPVKLSLNQSDLSDLLGVSRMTISKILTDMEGKGYLKRGYGVIEILDMETLSRY